MSAPTYAKIAAAAQRHGLRLRGGFAVTAEDTVPTLRVNGAEQPARTLLLFGNVGSEMWAVFSRSAEYHDGRPDPLNRWSTRVADALATEFNAQPLFPFGAPYQPFLGWAKKAERLENSKLGMLIHPRFGLWHAYRFALAFARPLAIPNATTHAQAMGEICANCAAQPCLKVCPVNAFTADGYDADACFGYLKENPESACRRLGCAARRACPEGQNYRYAPAHAAFHTDAFVASMASDTQRFG